MDVSAKSNANDDASKQPSSTRDTARRTGKVSTESKCASAVESKRSNHHSNVSEQREMIGDHECSSGSKNRPLRFFQRRRLSFKFLNESSSSSSSDEDDSSDDGKNTKQSQKKTFKSTFYPSSSESDNNSDDEDKEPLKSKTVSKKTVHKKKKKTVLQHRMSSSESGSESESESESENDDKHTKDDRKDNGGSSYKSGKNKSNRTMNKKMANSSDSKSDEKCDEDNRKEDNGRSESQCNVWPPENVWPPPTPGKKTLLAIGLACFCEKPKFQDWQKKAIKLIYPGRPSGDPYRIPPKGVRFSTPDFWEAAKFLHKWFAATRQEQKSIKPSVSKRAMNSNAAHLISQHVRDDAIEEAGGEDVAQQILGNSGISFNIGVRGRQVNDSHARGQAMSNGIADASCSSSTLIASNTWPPEKTDRLLAMMYISYFPFKRKNPPKEVIKALFPNRPSAHGQSLAPPLAVRCSSPEYKIAMDNVYNFNIATKTEQEKMKKSKAPKQRTIQRNMHKLNLKQNISNILKEFPDLEDMLLQRIPRWEEICDENEMDCAGENSGIEFVGRATSEVAREAEVETISNAQKEKMYKRPKSSDFLKSKNQLGMARNLKKRDRAIIASADLLDALHIPDDPTANLKETMYQVFVSTAEPTSNTGGSRKSNERVLPKTTVTIVRESARHFESATNSFKSALLGADLHQLEIIERKEGGESMKKMCKKQSKERLKKQMNPKRRKKSVKDHHANFRLPNTPFVNRRVSNPNDNTNC